MSWWGERLTAAVGELIDEGRFRGGRPLARRGSVHSLDVAPGRVSGQVQGSEAQPFSAVFLLTPLPDADAARVREVFDDPARVGDLVAGELPALGEPRYGLFPAYADELDFECTCPDWGWPCKHAAALVHAFGAEADACTWLKFRGVDVTPLLGTATPADGPGEPVSVAADALDDYFTAAGRITAPDVTFRPAQEDLDPELLRTALGASSPGRESVDLAVEWLRDTYRRLG